MKFSEEQVKDIVALKDSLVEQMDKHQESIEMLEKKYHNIRWILEKFQFYKSITDGSKKNRGSK